MKCLKKCMKILAALLLAACIPSVSAAQEKAFLTDSLSGQAVTVKEAAEHLQYFDVTVMGEFHDSHAVHQMELEMLTELYRLHGTNLVLSMEMFERDVQPVLDAYLAGRITEAELMRKARPWPNYPTDYRPMVEFAKAHHIPVLAGNIPRPLAALYARTGTLESVPDSQKQWLPAFTSAPEGAYKEKFKDMMKQVGHEGMAGVSLQADRMYQAQCLKDDVMAESMTLWMLRHPRSYIFHIQGEFHGAGRLGSVQKLQERMPEKQIALITPLQGEQRLMMTGRSAAAGQEADYFIMLPEEKGSHPAGSTAPSAARP